MIAPRISTASAREWLEPDGLGGFASGTVSGVRTRRYHAILLAAAAPPAQRRVLVNGFDAVVTTAAGQYAVSSQVYAPGVMFPDGATRIEHFTNDPWPTWRFALEDGTRVEHELFVPKGRAAAVLAWRLVRPRPGVTLEVRPFVTGRDYHALHRENPAFRFSAEESPGRQVLRPYPDLPGIVFRSNGVWERQSDWYRQFLYQEERARGLDHLEDCAAPGVLRFDLSRGEAVWVVTAGADEEALGPGDTLAATRALRAAERLRRDRFEDRLDRAADAYVVGRGGGKTIVAGYPWFTDWGRDTFIGLRGLCLATERLAEAGEILGEWANTVSDGMLPNRFRETGDEPEFNSVDASLWYVVAVHEYLEACASRKRRIPPEEAERLHAAVEAILEGYAAGTRFGIRADGDGLLACGEPGLTNLTWMDARVGDRVVTPRVGKPVEVQALWLNALAMAARVSGRRQDLLARGLASFPSRFWNEATGGLHDIVDVDHVPGRNDPTLRPNQIFAVGGLPLSLVEPEMARRVVDLVETRLWTPMGPRSLDPLDPQYRGRYEGGVEDRDAAYHQGTVWPWLAGPFVEAWVRVRGGSSAARREARRRFLEPMLSRLDEAGLGHIPEIADGDAPHRPRGCPFQAWSVGEALRLDRTILSREAAARAAAARRSAPGADGDLRTPPAKASS
jgi:predicted glycogen debranching enzyme